MRALRTLFAAALAAMLFASPAAFAQKKIGGVIIDTGTTSIADTGTSAGDFTTGGMTQAMSGLGMEPQAAPMLMQTMQTTATENHGIGINGRKFTGGTLGGKALVKRTLGTKLIWQAAAPLPEILLTPAMTSNTTPGPGQVIFSSYQVQAGTTYFQPWRAFNRKLAGGGIDFWASAPGTYPAPDFVGDEYIGFDFGVDVKKTVSWYRVYSRESIPQFAGHSARDWQMQGSNDLNTWTTIDTVVDNPLPTTNFQKTDRVLTVPARYRAFRILVTRSYGQDAIAVLGEIELYGHE